MERMTEEGYQIVTTKLPCVISVVKAIGTPRLPTLSGKIRSMELEVPSLGAGDLSDIQHEFLGLKGSPTKVVKIANSKITREGHTVRADDEELMAAAVKEFIDLLDKKGVLP
jgi:electron transfer flavoprotein beta subunit